MIAAINKRVQEIGTNRRSESDLRAYPVIGDHRDRRIRTFVGLLQSDRRDTRNAMAAMSIARVDDDVRAVGGFNVAPVRGAA